ncbi:MAG: hypothetical protein A2X12_08965 [Bacteroidetes bacterium GWE2_29_8]|nr:MAG: hypothetical protein A2X12_08965 [Bacteroidetes bacterium GWE2_29_8]OFY22682.1 MAG: hypothetical protein A2X02_02450 [Bacteroidetes bacterium GWF2_29_10]
MKNAKIIWLLIGFITYVTTANAQSSLTIEASQLYTSFKFTDTQGEKQNKEYSGILTGAYGIGYRFITEKGIMLRAGIGMRKAGATMVYDDINYSWDLQYADVKLGGGYILKKERISPYFNVLGFYSYMLRGFQSLNNQEFNLTDSKSLNEMDLGVVFSPGVQFKLSDAVSSFLEFNYIMGLQNIEKDDEQKATNIAYGLTLGLSFSITK